MPCNWCPAPQPPVRPLLGEAPANLHTARLPYVRARRHLARLRSLLVRVLLVLLDIACTRCDLLPQHSHRHGPRGSIGSTGEAGVRVLGDAADGRRPPDEL